MKTDKVEIKRLQGDLKKAKEQLRLSVEDQEATSEEFQTANEEILSTNEELQSINEELETAKEELQSTNEELTTVNEELQVRNSQLSLVNNDMQNFLANSDVPMVMVANNLSIRRITPAAERLLNFIPADIGRPITHLKLAIEIPNLEERLHTTVNTMASQEFELQDRRGIWYSVRIRPYKTEENKIDGVVLTLVDIDELKKNVVQLEKTANDLKEHQIDLVASKQVVEDESSHRKELERQKDEFIAILSHELRNPLSPILAHAELLRASAKQDSASNSGVKESADVIERHAKSMGRLLDDLLDVSSVISGNSKSQRVRLQPKRLQMNTAVRNAVETARTLAVEKKIDIVVKNTKTPVYIKGDPVRIEQILVNVLQNALKYSAPKTQVHVTLTTERKFVIIRIEDKGQGIEPLLLPKIFDLFTQGSHALKGKTPGLGIGLALARNLVQMHGGEISAESEGRGDGSTFTIKFPRAK